MTGKIYALGVGPGDKELITLKAHRILGTVGII
ncbi:MAG: SAM-dependent methyltransferase, partial [Rhizobiaceae bacterium]